MILAYLPEPEKHRLWDEIHKLLESATAAGVTVLEPNELVWIAFDGETLFGVATTMLTKDGDAMVLICAGFQHRRWIRQADVLVTRWAKDCGARKITMRGRMGWARYFRAFGWAASPNDDGLTDYEKVL